jgi:predicted transcriptional regulator
MNAATPTRQPTAAPEVTAQIVARQQAGQSVADIGRALHMTPAEVRDVLREAQPTQPVEVAP